MRLSVTDKAKKLLRDKRAQITKVTYNRIKGVVSGDHGEYRVEVLRNGNFNCECDNYIYTDSTVECSHILAIKIHPQYREWWPFVKKQDVVVMNERLYDLMPSFSIEGTDIVKQGSGSTSATISEQEFVQSEAGSNYGEITYFIRKKRFVEGRTYDEIITAVKQEFDVDISRGYVYTNVKDKPETLKILEKLSG